MFGNSARMVVELTYFHESPLCGGPQNGRSRHSRDCCQPASHIAVTFSQLLRARARPIGHVSCGPVVAGLSVAGLLASQRLGNFAGTSITPEPAREAGR